MRRRTLLLGGAGVAVRPAIPSVRPAESAPRSASVAREADRAVEVAERSPAGLPDAVDTLIADHGGRGVIHYRHPRG